MEKIKQAKIKQPDGTYSEGIPLGVDAENVDLKNKRDLETSVAFVDNSLAVDTGIEVVRDDIVDNLSSNSKIQVLSANMGKVLNENKADKTELPAKLPNPNLLTFTGNVNTTYDGSAPTSVNIPSPTLVDTSLTHSGQAADAAAVKAALAKYQPVGDYAVRKELPLLKAEDTFKPSSKAWAHNLPRGKFLGTSVTSAQYAAITSQTFEDLYVGDYWTIGGKDYVIAGINYYLNTGDTACTKPHLVMIPRNNMYNAQMHITESGGYEGGPANTTEGGYIGTDLYKTGLNNAKSTIKAAFPGHIISHRNYLINAVSEGHPSNGEWRDSEVDLMSEIMVYGAPICQPMLTGTWWTKNTIEKNQLPIFAYAPELINTRETYWLRDVVSSVDFAVVAAGGLADAGRASYAFGVRPAFLIG